MTASFSLTLHSLNDTAQAGRALASAVRVRNPGALLLYADLGMGKTTLTRALVEALPGGTEAEISSPSFTVANIYYTAPVVHHYDLYRLHTGQTEISLESLEESFDTPAILTIVEWAEKIAIRDLPMDGLSCRLSPVPGLLETPALTHDPQHGPERTATTAPAWAAVSEESTGSGRVLEVFALGPLGEECLRLFQQYMQ